MENVKNEIILGLDVSTTCIGYCITLDDGSEYGKILTMGHVAPKVRKCRNKIEELFLKKKIFYDEFICKFKDYGITKVVIEEPLLRSNNVNTVSILLLFNGMVSDCVYEQLGIVPEYISSYEARMYSFPKLLDIRKYNKKGEVYQQTDLKKKLGKKEFILFGGYVFDCDKKVILQGLVSEIFPDIPWLTNSKGELKKENFDANDAYIACLGFMNHERYSDLLVDGKIKMDVVERSDFDDRIEYTVEYWGKREQRVLYFV